jgi:transposase
MATKIQHIRTLRLKVKAEGYAWLNAAAIEVNQVWNFANATSYKAARPFAGQPVKTRMAKSVLDAGWGILKTQLLYKGQQAGRCVSIVSERNTTRTCSGCGSLTGPAGLDMLVVRTWMCRECGVTHDRDVNAARNILSAGRSSPSVCGNESSSSATPPSQTSRRCEARISALKTAA